MRIAIKISANPADLRVSDIKYGKKRMIMCVSGTEHQCGSDKEHILLTALPLRVDGEAQFPTQAIKPVQQMTAKSLCQFCAES